MIKKYFYPDVKYHEVGEIDILKLKEKGIKFAILDIDNTLVPYTEPTPNEKALEFLNKLKSNGITFCFVSNNEASRVELFNKEIGAIFESKGRKPLLTGIKKVLKRLDATKENTVMIGDQVFTDICCGKRAGFYTVLVDPIKEVETNFFRFKRYFEKKILKRYEKDLKRGKII